MLTARFIDAAKSMKTGKLLCRYEVVGDDKELELYRKTKQHVRRIDGIPMLFTSECLGDEISLSIDSDNNTVVHTT